MMMIMSFLLTLELAATTIAPIKERSVLSLSLLCLYPSLSFQACRFLDLVQ